MAASVAASVLKTRNIPWFHFLLLDLTSEMRSGLAIFQWLIAVAQMLCQVFSGYNTLVSEPVITEFPQMNPGSQISLILIIAKRKYISKVKLINAQKLHGILRKE